MFGKSDKNYFATANIVYLIANIIPYILIFVYLNFSFLEVEDRNIILFLLAFAAIGMHVLTAYYVHLLKIKNCDK